MTKQKTKKDTAHVLTARANYSDKRPAYKESFSLWFELDNILTREEGFEKRDMFGQIPHVTPGNILPCQKGEIEARAMIYFDNRGALHISEKIFPKDEGFSLEHRINFYGDRSSPSIRPIEEVLANIYRNKRFTVEHE